MRGPGQLYVRRPAPQGMRVRKGQIELHIRVETLRKIARHAGAGAPGAVAPPGSPARVFPVRPSVRGSTSTPGRVGEVLAGRVVRTRFRIQRIMCTRLSRLRMSERLHGRSLPATFYHPVQTAPVQHRLESGFRAASRSGSIKRST